MKKRLILLVDSPKYITSNCYQNQLLTTLKSCYRVTMISAAKLEDDRPLDLSGYDLVLSVLRLRTLHRILPKLNNKLSGHSVWIYE